MRISKLTMQMRTNYVLNISTKMYLKIIFYVMRGWRNVSPAPYVHFCYFDQIKSMQIEKRPGIYMLNNGTQIFWNFECGLEIGETYVWPVGNKRRRDMLHSHDWHDDNRTHGRRRGGEYAIMRVGDLIIYNCYCFPNCTVDAFIVFLNINI